MPAIKCLAVAALAASASAFVPTAPLLASKLSTQSRTSSRASSTNQVVMMAEKSQSLPFMEQPPNLDGSMAGDVGFDPIGFSNWINIKWLREAEIKHGRISMLAVVGYIATDLGYHLPGDMHAVGSLEAHDAAVKFGGMSQLLIWLSIVETISAVATFQMVFEDSPRAPGDFCFDPMGFSKKSEAVAAKYAKQEIKNGRLAMLAISGILTQAALTGKAFPYMS